MRTRAFRLKVGERLRSKTPTRGKGSSAKTKTFDEKQRDYVPRKGAKK